jgi:hypothetical protein
VPLARAATRKTRPTNRLTVILEPIIALLVSLSGPTPLACQEDAMPVTPRAFRAHDRPTDAVIRR